MHLKATRMLALALALCLASTARAADDAPVVLQPGDAAPVAGVLLPDALAVRRAKELAALRVENEQLKKDVQAAPSVPLVVVLVVLGVVAGGVAGYGVARAVK